MSPELGLYQVGINGEALAANTSIDPSVDRVRVTVVGHARARPILLDRFFQVVSLDEHHPDAFAHSRHGEAVLPEGDQVLRRYAIPRVGANILLNSVLTQRSGVVPSPDIVRRILEELIASRGPGTANG